jgi:hypothetical protein
MFQDVWPSRKCRKIVRAGWIILDYSRVVNSICRIASSKASATHLSHSHVKSSLSPFQSLAVLEEVNISSLLAALSLLPKLALHLSTLRSRRGSFRLLPSRHLLLIITTTPTIPDHRLRSLPSPLPRSRRSSSSPWRTLLGWRLRRRSAVGGLEVGGEGAVSEIEMLC